MEVMEIEITEVELKYCERCGGLWLREVGLDGVYCDTCAPKMAILPRKLPASVRSEPPVELEGWCGDPTIVCSEGGNA